MNGARRWFASLLMLLCAGRATAQATSSQFVSAIDDELLLKSFAVLASDSMQGRKIASPGGLRAREFIVAQLRRLGVEPLVPQFVASFAANVREAAPSNEPVSAATRNQSTAPSALGTAMRGVTGHNILGVIRGTEHPDRFILVSAHYDHIGLNGGQFHLGANDNASGAAALLAIADLFTAAKPKNSVILAFFDGGESGLAGANAFVRSPPVPLKRVAANINIDMIARASDDILFFVGERYQPRLSALATVVGGTGIVRIQQGHDGRDIREDLFRRSDQWVFHQRGVPAVLFTGGELSDYHLPSDMAGKVNIDFYVRATSAISDVIRRLDESIELFVPAKR